MSQNAQISDDYDYKGKYHTYIKKLSKMEPHDISKIKYGLKILFDNHMLSLDLDIKKIYHEYVMKKYVDKINNETGLDIQIRKSDTNKYRIIFDQNDRYLYVEYPTK